MECFSSMVYGPSDISGSYSIEYPLTDIDRVVFSMNAMSIKNFNLYKSDSQMGSFFI